MSGAKCGCIYFLGGEFCLKAQILDERINKGRLNLMLGAFKS